MYLPNEFFAKLFGNVITNGKAETDTSGWTAYNDSAAIPVDGTGGTWTNGSFDVTTTSPIDGLKSFLINKLAANIQGCGIAYAFKVSAKDQAKMLAINFDYLASANYADGDIKVWIYDVTNATLIQPSGHSVVKSNSVETFRGTFQTSLTGVDYRLLIHVASTNALAYTFKFDNVYIGPQRVAQGCPVTDWTDYTPIISWTSGVGTVTGKHRRIGDSLEGYALIPITGGVTATTLLVGIPSGLTIDSSKAPGIAGYNSVRGEWGAVDAGTSALSGIVGIGSSTQIILLTNNVAGFVNATNPTTWAINDCISVHFIVPIVGWSSNVVMSSDTDTRVVAARFTKNGNQNNVSATQITNLTTEYDTHGGWDAANNQYVVRVPGYYKVYMNALASTTVTTYAILRIAVSGYGYIPCTGDAPSVRQNGSCITPFLKAGDTIQFYTFYALAVNLLSGADTWFGIERLSGPSSIAASETVAARYYGNAGAAQTSPVAYDYINIIKDYDTHNAYNASTGIYTLPVSGKYQVVVSAVSVSSINSSADFIFYKNGVSRGFQTSYVIYSGFLGTTTSATGCFEVSGVAGDQIKTQLRFHTAATLSTGEGLMYVQIKRIGN